MNVICATEEDVSNLLRKNRICEYIVNKLEGKHDITMQLALISI